MTNQHDKVVDDFWEAVLAGVFKSYLDKKRSGAGSFKGLKPRR